MRMRICSFLIILLVLTACASSPMSVSTSLDPNLPDREMTGLEYKQRGDKLVAMLDAAVLPPAVKAEQKNVSKVIINAVSGGIGLVGIGLTALLSDETAVNWTGYGFSVITIAVSTYNLIGDSLTKESGFVSEVLNAQNAWRLSTFDQPASYDYRSDYNKLYRAISSIKFNYPVLASSIDLESL